MRGCARTAAMTCSRSRTARLTPHATLPSVLGERYAPGSEVEVTVDADGVRHVVGGAELVGSSAVERAAGREWRLSPGTFWQVHPALADTLAAVVGEWAARPTAGSPGTSTGASGSSRPCSRSRSGRGVG